jgi:single-stranded DNA-binding protein
MRIPYENTLAIAGYVNKKANIELRVLPNKRETIELQIATKYSYRVGNEWKEEDEWHTVVAYGIDAVALKEIVDKPSRTLFLRVVGRKRTRVWQAADNHKRQRVELIVESFAEILVPDRSGALPATAAPSSSDDDAPPAAAFKALG